MQLTDLNQELLTLLILTTRESLTYTLEQQTKQRALVVWRPAAGDKITSKGL